MMKNTEETHKLTESIYKGLSENFNPGIRQILVCGKVYHRALQGITAAARAYSEALLRMGQSARSSCTGGTEEIGEALYEIAEAHKEIQNRFEENTKALFTELILPLEQKLENDFKRSTGQFKKYMNGHKVVWSPYVKAVDSLKKFRKKSKNKPVYEEQKEAMHIRTLDRCKEKLDEFRTSGLKLALIEERKCHCFLLDRLNSMATFYSNHHKQSADTLLSGLPRWKQLSAKPHILPPQADRLLMLTDNEQAYDTMNSSVYRNGYLPEETRSLGSPYRRSQSVHDVYRRPIPTTEMGQEDYTKTLPHGRVVPPPPPISGLQVRAVYTHDGDGDNKLSFMEGDIINIVGEKCSEGWQYGLNTRVGKYGWFPLSFTEPLHIPPPRDPPPMLNGRVKSMGDLLDSRSLSDNGGYFMEHSMPGSAQRPKSLYEGSGVRMASGPTQPPNHHPGWNGPTSNMLGSYSLPRQFSGHGTHFSSERDHLYQFLPSDRQKQEGTTSCQETSVNGTNRAEPPSPPLPPPPSNADLGTTNSTPSSSSSTTSPSAGSNSLHFALHGSPARRSTHQNKLSHSFPSPPPPPPPPPPLALPPSHAALNGSSCITNLYQNIGDMPSGNGPSSRQQHSNPPPPPPPAPPMGPPPGIGNLQPAEDYMEEADDSNFRRNPSFANVSLRRTVTDDRSKPRIK